MSNINIKNTKNSKRLAKFVLILSADECINEIIGNLFEEC